MIDLLKDVLGIVGNSDYDLYLVVICSVALLWAVKMVISGILSTVLHIFH